MMDTEALMAAWKMDELPTCDVGLTLAVKYLLTCGKGVDQYGVEEPEDRLAEIRVAYMTMIEHGSTCDKCNEEGDYEPKSNGDRPKSIGRGAGGKGAVLVKPTAPRSR
jgi:hypothetical protein